MAIFEIASDGTLVQPCPRHLFPLLFFVNPVLGCGQYLRRSDGEVVEFRFNV